jgi:hypothetical protein
MNKTGVAAVASASAQAFSSGDLARRTVERRAIEAVILGTPAVNYNIMYQVMVRDAKSGEGSNKIGDNPPKTEILDAGTNDWSGRPPRGMEYWNRLDEAVQPEWEYSRARASGC